ncbi:UNVERIFIED_CONTAM: hypothetical protein FKN15_068073 [Acipenser sinensis]
MGRLSVWVSVSGWPISAPHRQQAAGRGGCTLMDSCGGCLAGDASLNITDCVWLQCDSGNSSCALGSEVPEGCSLYNEASLCAGKRAKKGQDAAQQSHFFHCSSNWDHNLDGETSLDLYNSISSRSSNRLGLPAQCAVCSSREGDWEREAGRQGRWEERKGISETGKSEAGNSSCALGSEVPEGCSLYNEASLCAGKRAKKGQDAAQQSHFFHCSSNWDHNLDGETSLDLYNSISSRSSNRLGLPAQCAVCSSREGDWEREAGRQGRWEERKGISETGKSEADAPPPTVPAPVYKQANFDLSSFIGGIILVLGIQSALFFIIKFFKTKDSTYQTM